MPDATRLVCRSRTLDLREPVVMGVLNVTPDSFSDGGRYVCVDDAIARARRMVEEGAAIIDVGGESTRPGAQPVAVSVQLERTLPVIERLASMLDVPLSIDTSEPDVMTAAVEAGAEIINDVRALRRPGALDAAAASGAAVCLMHMQGEPATMQQVPAYEDVLREVGDFLATRAAACIAAGISPERLSVDPGIGFGKTHEQNLQLIVGLPRLAGLGWPVLVGVSRKSVIGIITRRPAGRRDAGSSALAALCVERGARIVRAHDVAGTVDALRIARALALAGSREH